jgi:hypothetical protein
MGVHDGAAPDSDSAAGLVLCRCEDVLSATVERAVRELGARTVDEVKKLTRAGMGPCQGRVCAPLLRRALAVSAVPAAAAGTVKPRPPLRMVPLAALAAWGAALEEPAGVVSADVLWGRSRGGATVRLDEAAGPAAAGHRPAGMGAPQ